MCIRDRNTFDWDEGVNYETSVESQGESVSTDPAHQDLHGMSGVNTEVVVDDAGEVVEVRQETMHEYEYPTEEDEEEPEIVVDIGEPTVTTVEDSDSEEYDDEF